MCFFGHSTIPASCWQQQHAGAMLLAASSLQLKKSNDNPIHTTSHAHMWKVTVQRSQAKCVTLSHGLQTTVTRQVRFYSWNDCTYMRYPLLLSDTFPKDSQNLILPSAAIPSRRRHSSSVFTSSNSRVINTWLRSPFTEKAVRSIIWSRSLPRSGSGFVGPLGWVHAAFSWRYRIMM